MERVYIKPLQTAISEHNYGTLHRICAVEGCATNKNILCGGGVQILFSKWKLNPQHQMETWN